jgi:hypothetical protein
MANTGNVITLTLQEINPSTSSPTGVTKPNVETDPDYIPIEYNEGICPVTDSLACPVVVATPIAGGLIYEFSIPNSVANNPAITDVVVSAMNGATPQIIIPTTISTYSTPNFYKFTFTSLTTGVSYTIRIQYKHGSTVVATCNDGIHYVVL